MLLSFLAVLFAQEPTSGNLTGASPCPGVCFFRGNGQRNYYGEGDFTRNQQPQILWSYPPKGILQKESSVYGVPRLWKGNGWTGQPVVHKRADGITEVIFGAYDGAVHFVDIETGAATRPPFQTKDIIKGSVSLDPDGYPLLYFGSRDRYYRVLALDHVVNIDDKWQKKRDVLLSVYGDIPQRKGTSRDWDGNAFVQSDHLFLPGENAWFYIYHLNRSYDPNGKVNITPKRVMFFPSWDTPSWKTSLITLIGDKKSRRNLAIESSPALYKDRVYFANSGGRVVGLDIPKALRGETDVVFDFWTGDDVDSTVVIDEDGMLYVSVEYEVKRPKSAYRKKEVGQLVKLNPYTDKNPIVWKLDLVDDPKEDAGIWATPALLKRSFAGKNFLYVPLHTGRYIAVDAQSGKIVWDIPTDIQTWSSPNIIYHQDRANLITIDNHGKISNYDLTQPDKPNLLWSFALPAAEDPRVEASALVWDSKIVVGRRDGKIYCVGYPK